MSSLRSRMNRSGPASCRSFTSRSILRAVCVGSAFVLSACNGQFQPFLETNRLPDSGVLSSGASLGTIIVQDPNKMKKICLGRGADAVYEQSDDADFSLSIVSTGKTDSDKSGVQDNAGEQEMTGRTPAILMARELFYRGCELSHNFNLSKDEAIKIFNSTLQTVERGWTAETQKLTISIGETLSIKDSDTVSNSTSDNLSGTSSSTDSTTSSTSDSSAGDSSAASGSDSGGSSNGTSSDSSSQ
jgi:hypothetical protein